MHLLGPGIGKHLWRIISGDFGTENNPLYLDVQQRQLLGARIAASRSSIPSSFAGDCGDITYQSGFFRAVDWIHFVRYYVPTILLEFYDDVDTRNALIDLANIYHYAFSRELKVSQLGELKVTSTSFTSWLQEHVDKGHIAPFVFTPNVHYVSHLYKYIERVGSLPFVAAFAMERAIGMLKRRMNLTRYPGTNAGNVMIDLAAIRRCKRHTQSNDNDDDHHNDDHNDDHEQVDPTTIRLNNVISLSDDEDSPEIWGPFGMDTVRDLNCHSYLRDFWAWQNGSYTGVSIAMDELLETGSQLFKDKMTYGGSDKESFVVLHVWVDENRQKRTRQNVIPIHRQYFGSIKFFFAHEFRESRKLLAFVEVYRTVEIDGQYPYMTGSGGSKYLVVDINDIVGFAGRAQGWNTRQYIYWKRQNIPPNQDLPIDHELQYV